MTQPKKSSGTGSAEHIIDVKRPGKSAPAGNSKSVIISNRPLLKDPMMVDEESPTGEKADKSSLTKTSGEGSIIKPPTKPGVGTGPLTAPLLKDLETDEPEESDASTPEKPAETSGDKVIEPPKTEAKAEVSKDSEKKPEPDEADKPDEVDKSDKLDDDAPKPKKDEVAAVSEAEAAEATAQAKRQEAVDKLADSKQYFLPIETLERRRSKHFVLAGVVLSLVLIVAWVDIALDAGLIHLGSIKAVTHFFSN